MDQQFVFTGREKMTTFIMMGVGIISIILGLVFGYGEGVAHAGVFDNHRFWTNMLNNSVFFLGVSFLTFFFMCAFIVAYGGWFVAFKRVMEAISMFIPIGGILVAIVIFAGIFGAHDIYFWTHPEYTDPTSSQYDILLDKKSPLLNTWALGGSTVFFVLIWTFFASKIRNLSKKQDENGVDEGVKWYMKTKVWSAAFLPIGAFSSAFAIWFWLMSIEPHWYSTMFAWYATGSLMASSIAAIILFLHYLQGRGYLPEVLLTHFHDLGKFLFGFSIFWTYLWFSQYMLIWYANIGEETIHFQNQLAHFPAVFYGLLLLNFVLPFLILMRNSTKWKTGSAIFVSILVLFGHWLDFFMMSKSGVYIELHHHLAHGADHAGGGHGEMPFLMGFNFPGLIEIGTMIGFLGLFLFVIFTSLTKMNLVPKNDPYLAESLHHQGGPLGPELDHH